jgi:hypothetical protein
LIAKNWNDENHNDAKDSSMNMASERAIEKKNSAFYKKLKKHIRKSKHSTAQNSFDLNQRVGDSDPHNQRAVGKRKSRYMNKVTIERSRIDGNKENNKAASNSFTSNT